MKIHSDQQYSPGEYVLPWGFLYSPYSPGPFCTPLDLFVLPVLYSPLGSTLFVNLIELGKLIMS